ncbi:zinc-ribbon domain-containing protein [Clostridium tunisiense]|uniref:zinc-ribbon domain-containing protein n=1 Tax=Clostridium tunisiense TaxID=219748 RepID=UPI0002ED7DE6|nr:zinc-ribbon domain-containing protein [Clostridium tunisiense]
MICTNCNKEITNESKFCPECGNPFIIESTNNSEVTALHIAENTHIKQKQNKRKKIIISIILLVTIVGSILGGFAYKKQAAHKKYEYNFNVTVLKVLGETIEIETMCSKISSFWHDVIFGNMFVFKENGELGDFNDSIKQLQKAWKDNGTLSKREQAKAEIETQMKSLQNPPKDYESAYALLVELYSIYGQIYSQGTSPTGSLTSYNADVDKLFSDFNKIYDKMTILKPELKKIK